MKKQTKKIYGNCLLALIYLIKKGKASSIIVVSSHTKLWPHHYLALTKKGNAIHFHYILSDEDNPTAPWWFLGEYKVINKKYLLQELKNSGRKLLFITNKIWLYFCIILIVCILLYIPWMFTLIFLNTKYALKSLFAR